MPTYVVRVQWDCPKFADVEIEAASAQAAEEHILDAIDNGDTNWLWEDGDPRDMEIVLILNEAGDEEPT